MSYLFSKYSKIPSHVKKDMNSQMWNFNNSGLSIIETSHRNVNFANINNETIDSLRSFLQVPTNYKILLLQGGQELTIASIPNNLLNQKKKCRYILSGPKSTLAYNDAKTIFNSVVQTINYENISTRQIDLDSAYTYFCIQDVESGFYIEPFEPQQNQLLVADATSVLGLKKIKISNYGIIFGAAEFSIGAPGVTIVIVRQDLIEKVPISCPSLMSYQVNLKANSIFNTPNCFSVYLLGAYVKFLKIDGLQHYQNHINKLSDKLVNFLQKQNYEFFYNNKEMRSKNVIIFKVNPKEKQEMIKIKLEKEKLLVNSNEQYIRINLHLNQSEDDINRLEELLQ